MVTRDTVPTKMSEPSEFFEFTVDAAIAEALLEQVGNYEAVVATTKEK